MPAKSKAQFKKMFILEKQGKISDSTRREFTDSVDFNRLPAHVKNMQNARRPSRKEK